MHQRKTIGIQSLLLRTFLPAVLVVAIALAILVYNLQYALIMDGFDRKLVTISALTGAMIDPSDHDFLMTEAQSKKDPTEIESTEHYIRNVEPMRRIREKLDLTYLYTQALGGEADIYYILDSSLGDDHSPIGSEDELPVETLAGLRNAESQGKVYISPVEYQKQWGLLKTAAAPVYGAEGAITATAGADVDISVIQIATQNALFASAVIGMVSILACLFVTFQIVQRIARPIEVLRQEALRIAAGDHNQPIKLRHPREAAHLRNTLATVTTRMMKESTKRMEIARDQQHNADEQCLIDTLYNTATVITLCNNEKLLTLWAPTDRTTVESALAIQSMTLLRERMLQAPRLMNSWKILANLEQGICASFDRQAKSICTHGGSITVRVNNKVITLDNEKIADLSSAARASVFLNGEEVTLFESAKI